MKNWIKINLSKITLTLTIISTVSGVIGLIIGSLAYNQTKGYQSFLDHDYSVHWGGNGTTIWKTKIKNGIFSMDLYFNIKPIHQNDVKWNGIYSSDYFIKN